MLLGLALEYITEMNQKTIPSIDSTFERVASAQAYKFIDEYFESLTLELELKFSESHMPYEGKLIEDARKESLA